LQETGFTHLSQNNIGFSRCLTRYLQNIGKS